MSPEEFDEDLKFKMHGSFGPFNPREPLRSVYQNKIKECLNSNLDKEKYSHIYEGSEHYFLQGEEKDTPELPPGAMY